MVSGERIRRRTGMIESAYPVSIDDRIRDDVQDTVSHYVQQASRSVSVRPKYTEPVADELERLGRWTYDDEVRVVKRSFNGPDLLRGTRPAERDGVGRLPGSLCNMLAEAGILGTRGDRYQMPSSMEAVERTAAVIRSTGEMAFLYDWEDFLDQVTDEQQLREAAQEGDITGEVKGRNAEKESLSFYGSEKDREQELLRQTPLPAPFEW